MQKSTWVFVGIIIGLMAGGLLYRHFAQETDSRGATRLMRALEENNVAKMEDLLTPHTVNMRDKSGQTALFYAARHASQPQIIHKLILAGADTFATDKQGNTPLMTAATYNPNPVITKVLARSGGFSSAQQQNKDKALLVAARYNTLPVIKTLLIAHADPAFVNTDGRTAASYLMDNERLSEAEKTDLRQVMMLLEILDARAQFAASAHKPDLLKPEESVSAPQTEVDKSVEEPLTQPVAEEKELSENLSHTNK